MQPFLISYVGKQAISFSNSQIRVRKGTEICNSLGAMMVGELDRMVGLWLLLLFGGIPPGLVLYIHFQT